MPLNGLGQTITTCNGILYDGGGPTGNYADQSDAYITIAPQGATNITLNFNDFDIEPGDAGYCNYDFLEIFDGSSTSSPSLGRFCNTTGSPGTIQTTGGAVTLWIHSDQALNKRGFEMYWYCNLANTAPVANFSISYINPCAGFVLFADNSSNNPTQWLWDFGDGNYSTLQNPSHTYSNSGVYTVTLIVSNEYGADTITYENLVTINLAQNPVVNDTTVCVGEDVFIVASSQGETYWYYDFIDNQPFYIGDTLQIYNINQSQNYWVQNVEIFPPIYVGETNINSMGGFFSNAPKHYLVFDCYQQCELVSVLVNASNEGYRLIELQDNNGNVLQSKNVFIPQGISRIDLNFQLPVQNNLRLVGPSYPNLWRNSNCNCAYPYTIPDVLSIKYSSTSTNPTGYYYYFYNWEVKLPDCYSAKIPVNINVDTCQSVESFLDFNIHPVVNEDYIYVNYKFNDEDVIKILDITGKSLSKSIQYFDSGITIDISNFSSGVYFIYISSKEKFCLKKFIKL